MKQMYISNSRFSNPTVKEFVDRVCALEGAEDGFATSSGMRRYLRFIHGAAETGDHLISFSAILAARIR
jgi:O-succinylhomoserine sulfhydrylase